MATTFLELWQNIPEYRTLLDGLKKGYGYQVLTGLPSGEAAFLAAAVYRARPRTTLVVVPDTALAERWVAAFSAWLPGEAVELFPEMELVPYRVMAHSLDVAEERLRVLNRLVAEENPVIVVAPAGALLRGLAPREEFASLSFELRVGGELPPEELARRLVRMGYERVELVEGPRQFSLRGGILDLFPLTEAAPLRLEWFDVEIDSIRTFDVENQRSRENRTSLRVTPAREMVLPRSGTGSALRQIAEEFERVFASLERSEPAAARRLKERVGADLEMMDETVYFHGWEAYAPYLYPGLASLIDYLPESGLILLQEPERVKEQWESATRLWNERVTGLLQEGQLLPGQSRALLTAEEVEAALARHQSVGFSLFPRQPRGRLEPKNSISLTGKQVPVFHGQFDLFTEELRRWRQQRYRILLVTPGGERARHLMQLLGEQGIVAGLASEEWRLPEPGQVLIGIGDRVEGFEAPNLRLVVVDDSSVSGRPRRRRRPAKAPEGAKIRHFEDLQVGDYVVHVHHGIGRYLGMQTLEVQGVHRDYMVIKYEGADRLYVPSDQIDLVQKYIGGEGKAPKLYRLGGNEWARVKERVKQSVRQMAEELLELYAAREALEGHAYSPDGPWQQEFEDSFPYQETPDQVQAIQEIKADMEKPQPMDRLLCGDVGYGKTEVALRAAFKAVMDGKQVAVLVPTTILAQQHYITFKERFQGFPVKVAVLSRFRSKKEQEETVTALRRGAVDVVIGTHRLVQGDINFKNLGLVIVDEEQRFGVAHKEKLKQLRQTVDVLTLTATPIPRTLHMSLVGLRDMSVIETPPEDRYPVETYVVEYNDGLVRDAIQRELSRGGQVYYVHNRVQSIDQAFRRVHRLVPEARVGVAHGQMAEEQLENVMMEFLEGELDVLVTTTIIESGLDIPNVNTLIVEDADHLGLAQLYQIRGRVGRSNRLAFAYFTYRRDRVLTEAAEKRLQAIREFTELGSGFKIALRDLEIRGAGNILGPEQHGFVVAVGFDLYTQLLEEAVRELRGEKRVPVTLPAVELAVDAYIGDEYIADPRQKVEFYKKINGIQTAAQAEEVAEELLDRYGELPEPVEALIELARLRLAAAELGILAISQERDWVRLQFAGYLKDLVQEFGDLQEQFPRRVQIRTTGKPVISFRISGEERPTRQLLSFLDETGKLPSVRRWREQAANPV